MVSLHLFLMSGCRDEMRFNHNKYDSACATDALLLWNYSIKTQKKNIAWRRLTYYFTEMNGPGCFESTFIRYSGASVVLPVRSQWNEARGAANKLQLHFFFSGCITAALRSKVSCLSPRPLFTYVRTANVLPLPVHTVGLQMWAEVQ